MEKIKALLRLPQFQCFLFSLIFVLFSWPIVDISETSRVKGTLAYVFFAWIIVSYLLYLVAWSLKTDDSSED